jgi:glycosyltransferase involved in cell wall biosynthesis
LKTIATEDPMSTTPAKNTFENAGVARPIGRAVLSAKGAMGDNRSSTTLSVIVPVYNERYLIEASLNGLAVLDESPRLQQIKVIVVNDCSTDATAEAIRHFQSHLESSQDFKKFTWIWLQHEKNMGKGAAIRTALEYVDTELVVMHDADLEYHPRDLLQMVDLFLFEDADAVFGSRFMPGGYKRALFFRHEVGNKFLTFLCDLVCDLNLTDMETCYKMVRADLLKSIPLESDRFGIEPEITIKLAKRDARIFELPIRYSGRTYGEGKKITWKDGVRALGALLKFGISDRIYKADEHGSEILARLNRAPRFTKWMADTIRPYLGERVLEIGAGIGNLTANLVPRTVYWASDINPHYLDRLKKLQLTRPYLRVQFTDASAGETYPQELFDSVICLNVVEHLEDDVNALRNIRASLQKNGRAIVLVPNGPELYGSLDRVLGHYRRYTKKRLTDVCEQAGFQVEGVVKFTRIGAPGWWLNGRLLRKETFGFWQIKVLNTILPVIRPIDRFLPFPHLSWIVILRVDQQMQESPAQGPAGAMLQAQGDYPPSR